MEFNDFKVGQTYFAISSGQYLGAFHILRKNEQVMKILISYYGGEVRVELVDQTDLENEEEFEWIINSIPMSVKPDDDRLRESLHEIIEAIFIRRNVVLKIIRGRK